jgi:copper transport protein
VALTATRPIRLAAGLGAALALTAGTAVTALAHASLISSSPGSGSELSAAPTQVLLQFDVPVNLHLSTVTLQDDAGQPVDGALIDAGAGASSTLAVQLPTLPRGVYRLAFRARDDTDLHETRGTIVFGVQRAADVQGQPAVSPSPSYLETGVRWLELAGTCLVVGVVAVWLFILPAVGRRRPLSAAVRTRLVWLAAVGCLTIAFGRAGQLWVTASSLAAGFAVTWQDAAWSALSSTWFGLLWSIGLGVTVLTLVAIRAAIPREGSRLAGGALASATLALVTVTAWSSHGDNRSGIDPLLLAIRAVHLGAAGLWVGGLTVLVFLFAGAMWGGSSEATAALTAFRRFTGLAVVSVGLLTASGLLLAARGVDTPAELLTTTYGLTLVAKMIAGVAAIGFGIRHMLLLTPRRGAGLGGPVRLARSVPFEVAAMLVVLWAAAGLGATAPATTPTNGAPELATTSWAPALETAAMVTVMVLAGTTGVRLLVGYRRRALARAAAADR